MNPFGNPEVAAFRAGYEKALSDCARTAETLASKLPEEAATVALGLAEAFRNLEAETRDAPRVVIAR